MSSNRHLARVIALQSLYEHEFRTRAEVEGLQTDIAEILGRNLAVYKDSMDEESFVRDLVDGTMQNVTKADELIVPAAPEWPIDQIAMMDLTILRLAIYELYFKREVPPKVVINEAVELAKSFGGENSSKFINGVLGTIYRQSEFYDPTEDHKLQREQSPQKAPAQRPATESQPAGDETPSKSDQPDDKSASDRSSADSVDQAPSTKQSSASTAPAPAEPDDTVDPGSETQESESSAEVR